LSDETNRGAVFGRVVLYASVGGLLGPLVAGQLANMEERLPWLAASVCCALSSFVLLLTRPGEARSANLVELAEPLGERRAATAA
jgi:MFS family permease